MGLPQLGSTETIAVRGKPRRAESLRGLMRFALIVLAIVVPIRLFVAQPFIVSGASMLPTFYHGEYLIIDELSYRFMEPKRGDVIIFSYPLNPRRFYIKRIIGLPGENVELNGSRVIIHGQENDEGLSLIEPYVAWPSDGLIRTYRLDQNEYFVMGDNRSMSSDSRVWGPLNTRFIKGRPVIRLFPFSRIEIMPGEYRAKLQQ